ncbi:hypothetical protein JTB14_028176 [Gonioctena quinquepunctata]|nr:hypothetical protein JTB14_028176 [Gonioctena quinquepunctata]
MQTSSTTDRKLESIEPPKELPKELNQAVQPVQVISEISRGVHQNNDVQDRPNNGSKTSSKIINRNNNDTQHNSNNNNEPVASCSFTIESEERRTKLVIPSLPVAIRKENRRIRQKAPSMVITSTPVKDYLEEKERRSQEKT